jgi:aminopeptidase N
MLSRPVKRIEDVKGLRSHQFSEDAGPLSHPIKPKSYIEINNFYTATIYEKGAEVIRMIHTLIGKENFRKGMDLYFKRHDGQAVTTEDFIAAMSDASNVCLEQFKVWYDQNGTPELIISTNYDEDEKTFSFTIEQKAILNNDKFEALHMPFSFGLISQDGAELHSGNIELTKKIETFTVENIKSNPIPSWNRGYTAPVIIDYKYSIDQLIKIMSSDTDEFNQYNATQDLYYNVILNTVSDLNSNVELKLNEKFVQAFGELLNQTDLDEAFKSYAISLPTQMNVNEKLKIYDYENVKKALTFVKSSLANKYAKEFKEIYMTMSDTTFDLDAKSMGRRSLKNTCLSYLTCKQDSESFNLAKIQYNQASNMNDEISALKDIVHNYPQNKKDFLDTFFNKWKSEPLVMQKWFGVQATAPYMTIADIKLLEKNEVYDSKVPNFVRSILRNCLRSNPSLINNLDGSGYEFLVDRIIEIDIYNPSLASGLAKSLNHMKKVDKSRSEKLKVQLNRLLENKLSKDTFEVVTKNLKA